MKIIKKYPKWDEVINNENNNITHHLINTKKYYRKQGVDEIHAFQIDPVVLNDNTFDAYKYLSEKEIDECKLYIEGEEIKKIPNYSTEYVLEILKLLPKGSVFNPVNKSFKLNTGEIINMCDWVVNINNEIHIYNNHSFIESFIEDNKKVKQVQKFIQEQESILTELFTDQDLDIQYSDIDNVKRINERIQNSSEMSWSYVESIIESIIQQNRIIKHENR